MEFKSILMPKRLLCEKETRTETYGKFYAEPFERGFGVTVGNSLRRILLSSIQGAAASSVSIEKVNHEFSTIKGVKEDVPDILLSIKSLYFKLPSDVDRATVRVDQKGAKVVTAGDIDVEEGVEIMNPDQHIATLSKNAHLKMEIEVTKGRGYVPASEREDEERPIGLVLLDASYSPIVNVKYFVENARVGQRTDYDKLIMEIWTDGGVTPDAALSFSAKILKDHLDLFISIEEEVIQSGEIEEEIKDVSPLSELEEKLDKSIEELELSVRSYNCLEAAGIKTIRDLVQKNESEMLKYRNFGRKSLNEIKSILKDMGLSFGMRLDERGIPITGSEGK